MHCLYHLVIATFVLTLTFVATSQLAANEQGIRGQKYLVVDHTGLESEGKMKTCLRFNGHLVHGCESEDAEIRVFDRFGTAIAQKDSVVLLTPETAYKTANGLDGVDKLLAIAEIRKQTDLKNALEAYQEAAKQFPDDSAAKLGIAECLARLLSVDPMEAQKKLNSISSVRPFKDWKIAIEYLIEIRETGLDLEPEKAANVFTQLFEKYGDNYFATSQIADQASYAHFEAKFGIRRNDPVAKTLDELVSEAIPKCAEMNLHLIDHQVVLIRQMRYSSYEMETDLQELFISRLNAMIPEVKNTNAFCRDLMNEHALCTLIIGDTEQAMELLIERSDMYPMAVSSFERLRDTFYTRQVLTESATPQWIVDRIFAIDLNTVLPALIESEDIGLPIKKEFVNSSLLNRDVETFQHPPKNAEGDSILAVCIKQKYHGGLWHILSCYQDGIRDIPIANGDYAMHTAVRFGDPVAVAMLCESGFDGSKQSSDATSPLDLALTSDRYICASILIGKGALCSNDSVEFAARKLGVNPTRNEVAARVAEIAADWLTLFRLKYCDVIDQALVEATERSEAIVDSSRRRQRGPIAYKRSFVPTLRPEGVDAERPDKAHQRTMQKIAREVADDFKIKVPEEDVHATLAASLVSERQIKDRRNFEYRYTELMARLALPAKQLSKWATHANTNQRAIGGLQPWRFDTNSEYQR